MYYYPVTKEKLEQELTACINETESELTALKAVKINTKHKTLTNRAVDGGTIGDYIGIGKALYVNYMADRNHRTLDVTAYTYLDENGEELGVDGMLRISRTMTPSELQDTLNLVIESREATLKSLKIDFVKAGRIVEKYNKLASQINDLKEASSWVVRNVLK